MVGERLPAATIAGWLRLPDADHALLGRLTHGQAYAQELLPSASQLTEANAAADGLYDYFSALIRERRKSPATTSCPPGYAPGTGSNRNRRSPTWRSTTS
ncbi:hypothetical protein NKH77_38620 [Streptomyces sp. M19]